MSNLGPSLAANGVSPDRLLAAYELIFDALLARLKAYIPWEYTVRFVYPGPPVTVDLLTTDPSMPNLSGIIIRPGSDGSYCTPVEGSIVVVQFTNGNFSKPRVVGTDPENHPTSITLPSPTTTATNGGTVDLVSIGGKADTEIQNIWAALNALQTIFYAGGTAGLPVLTTGIYLPPAPPAGPPYVPLSTKGSVLKADQ